MARPPSPSRRSLILGAGLASGALIAGGRGGPALAEEPAPLIELSGPLTQGGAIMGRVGKPLPVKLDGDALLVDAEGRFVAGFDRDAKASARLTIGEGASAIVIALGVRPREFAKGQQISGLTRGLGEQGGFDPALDDIFADPETLAAAGAVSAAAGGSLTRDFGAATRSIRAYSEAELAQIRKDAASKSAARDSRADVLGALETWDWPAAGKMTSPWGAARTYNGGVTKIHYGVDVAAPKGAPVKAPAAALVALAEPEMFFEGGCVFLDHGQGLLSIYLHMDAVSVAKGDRIAKGDLIGKVGNKGRSTGPHLCWRLAWRGRNLDPTLLTASPTPPRA